MPLATSSLILQNTSLDLLLLPTSDALFGASNRVVPTAKIKAGTTSTTAPIGTTSLSLASDTAIFVKQGTSLSFSGDATSRFRRQVIINQDVVIDTTAASVNVTPLLRPIVSTATALATETVGIANLRYVVNHSVLTISCSAGNGATTVTTSTGDFSSVEVGDIVAGTSVPSGTYVTAKASNTSLTISAAVTAAITSANLTFTSAVAPTPLTGIQTLDLNNQETQVDTTSFGSGSGSEAAIVRFNRSYSVNGIALIGDEALERIVKPVAGFNNSFLNREVYAIATTTDGEAIEGVAKIMALNFPANQNEVKKYSFTLMYQGNASWIQPYNY